MKDSLQRYLLGDTTEDERAEVEKKYFADDELFEELVEVEHDLVDAYIDGLLTPAERMQFEERFMSTPERKERVEFARTLKGRSSVDSHRGGGASPKRWWLAAAASFALVGFASAWLIFAPRQPEERPQVVSRPPVVQPPVSVTTPPPESLLTLVLTPGATREGNGAAPLVLRSAPQWVQLDLKLDADRYESYTAELQDVEGQVLWSEKSLRASDGSLKPRVPAKLLPPGDYVVVVYGAKGGAPVEVNNYTFTVMALPK